MTTIETRPGDVTPSATDGDAEVATAGWYADPYEMHRMRYFTGSDWTDHVTHFGPTPCPGCSR